MFTEKRDAIMKEIDRLKNTIIKPTDKVNEFLEKNNSSKIAAGVRLSELLKRTELNYKLLEEIDEAREELPKDIRDEVEIMVKYEGYIKMQEEQVVNFKKLEKKLLPEDINYDDVKGIRIEARQKLNKFRPHSIGQASRISGVSPADISVLLVYLEQIKNRG